MSNSENMRKMMVLMEAPYEGPLKDPNVSYSSEEKKGEITKVIANLSSYQSGRYTKLGRNLNRIKWLSEKIDQLKEEVKGEAREAIADLFHAEDACRTRVVETVGFTFNLTKDPAPQKSVQYAKVLEELEGHLTPELVAVLEGLKNKFSTTIQKAPSLKASDKRMESVELNEGIFDNIRAWARKFYDKITSWGKRYDAKLDQLRAQAGLNESASTLVEWTEAEQILDDLLDTAMEVGAAIALGDNPQEHKNRMLELKDQLRRFLA